MGAARFVVCFATRDDEIARLHAYADGDGSLRDNNHVLEIVKTFARGNENKIITRAPEEGERVMFEVWLHVKDSRRNTSSYYGCDYRQIQPCPQCVAEAGMNLYRDIKHLLRRARVRKQKEAKHE